MATIKIAEDETALIRQLAVLIAQAADAAITARGVFNVGVSGGSLVKFLAEGLQGVRSDFSHWNVFFCDERVVPEDDPESTYGLYRKTLDFLPPDQYVKIKAGVSADVAAIDYEQRLKAFFPNCELPRFDMLLLGMGPDGHTCSLFPGHPLLQETGKWVAPIVDSPKPPPARVTLTFPVINNAACCVFAIAGAGKAEMVKRILKDKESLPATMVNPQKGDLIWILDKAASSLL